MSKGDAYTYPRKARQSVRDSGLILFRARFIAGLEANKTAPVTLIW